METVDPFPVLTTALNAVRLAAEAAHGSPNLTDAVWQFVIALNETQGGRELLNERANFVESHTSGGTEYAKAYHAAMRCIEHVEPHHPVEIGDHEIPDRLIELRKVELPHSGTYELGSVIDELDHVVREHQLDGPEYCELPEYKRQAMLVISHANNIWADACDDMLKIHADGHDAVWALLTQSEQIRV